MATKRERGELGPGIKEIIPRVCCFKATTDILIRRLSGFQVHAGGGQLPSMGRCGEEGAWSEGNNGARGLLASWKEL